MTDQSQNPNEPIVSIQRIYVKDLSLETHDTPKIFQEDWAPAVSVDLSVSHTALEQDFHEVVLTVTVKGQKDNKDILLIEVQQAGVFQLTGFDDKGLEHLLNVYSPGVLFPYAREVIADMSNRASFPPLNLAPINFQALHEYRKQEEEKGKSSGGESAGSESRIIH